ncbi:hypothetical protein [Curtobacterium sp. VKM Ac-2852]|uniref:hypothetical protein n=1 Tax=Curtobacterium sp. VKM Ac-2852 TaxID=2739024 RepID=UPI00349F1DFA
MGRLTTVLRGEFPETKGLSPRNRVNIRAFAEGSPGGQILQQAGAQLPWTYHGVRSPTR